MAEIQNHVKHYMSRVATSPYRKAPFDRVNCHMCNLCVRNFTHSCSRISRMRLRDRMGHETMSFYIIRSFVHPTILFFYFWPPSCDSSDAAALSDLCGVAGIKHAVDKVHCTQHLCLQHTHTYEYCSKHEIGCCS